MAQCYPRHNQTLDPIIQIDRQIDSLYLLRVKPIKYDTYLPQGPPVSKWLVDKGTMYIKVKMKKKDKRKSYHI